MEANWDKFPWANYMAQNQDGTIWFYKDKPYIDSDSEVFWNSDAKAEQEYNAIPNWKDTLIQRPLPEVRFKEEILVFLDGKWYAGQFFAQHSNLLMISVYDQKYGNIPFTSELKWKYISELTHGM